MSEADRERYLNASHAMQTGVAMEMNYEPGPTSPKHLRVGVNSALVEHGVLIKLLVDKGLFTLDEFEELLADGMEEEVGRYKQRLKQRLGADIDLI